MTTTDKVCAYVKLHPPEAGEVGYDKKVAKKFNCAPEYVRKLRRKLGLTGRIGNGYTDAPNTPKDSVDSVASAISEMLRKSRKPWTVEALSSKLDVGVAKVVMAIERLKASGSNLSILHDTVELAKELLPDHKPSVIDISDMEETVIEFGLTADNHLGSKYERMDVLNALFDIWAAKGIKTVYQLGNMIEGERHSKTDIHTFTMQGQVDYFVRNWPARPGITTEFVTGDDHEGWYVQDEGINIGLFMELMAKNSGRTDMKFIGHMEKDIKLQGTEGSSVMRLIHAGGGSAYAMSYAAQKIVEAYQGGEKPNVLLVGHYHKMGYFYPREVHCILAGCTKDQDTFMRKNKLAAHVGGWTIRITLNKKGNITSFTPTMIPFFNLGYYEAAWGYRW